MTEQTLAERDDERRTGWYWVKVAAWDHWTIGNWSSRSKLWSLNGSPMSSQQLAEIDDHRIVRHDRFK